MVDRPNRVGPLLASYSGLMEDQPHLSFFFTPAQGRGLLLGPSPLLSAIEHGPLFCPNTTSVKWAVHVSGHRLHSTLDLLHLVTPVNTLMALTPAVDQLDYAVT